MEESLTLCVMGKNVVCDQRPIDGTFKSGS